MKKKSKVLKTALLLFVTLLLLTSCERDLYELPEQNKFEQLKISFKKFKEFENEPKLIEKIVKYNQKLEQDFRRKHGTNYRTANIDISSVDFSNALYIEKQNGEHSYTFVINDPSTSEIINLVLASKVSGDYKPYVIEYNLSDEDIINLQNGATIDTSNKTEISEFEILSNQLVANGGCYEIIERWVEIPCAIDGCMNPQYTTFDLVYEMVYTCNEGGSGGAMGGGGSGSDSGIPPGGGSPYTGGTGSNPFLHNGTGFNTSPLFQDNKNPCVNLTKPDQQNIKPTVDALKQKLAEGVANEWGSSHSSKYIYDPTLNENNLVYENSPLVEGTPYSVSVDIGPRYTSSTHLHPKGSYPIFSWVDLHLLRETYKECTATLKSQVSIQIVCHNDANPANPIVYSLTVNDFNALNSSVDQILNNPKYNNKTIEEKFQIIQDALADDFNKNNLELFFLKHFQSYGVSLYKANNDLTNWTQLELLKTDTNPEGVVNQKPCN